MSHTPIGLFYGSSTCYTQMTAEKIQQQLGDTLVSLHNVADCALDEANHYRYLILGIPTWDYGELQEDWENIWPALAQVNWQGKQVALFGQGDQVGYAEWFQDALGYLHDYLVSAGALPAGYWPNEDYAFIASRALTADQGFFVGLALDDENQFDLSEGRIARWCSGLRAEWGL